jgi:hypothetical protein
LTAYFMKHLDLFDAARGADQRRAAAEKRSELAPLKRRIRGAIAVGRGIAVVECKG